MSKRIPNRKLKPEEISEILLVKKEDIPEEIEKLKALMKIASANLDFEKCIEIRDNIAKLKIKMRK